VSFDWTDYLVVANKLVKMAADLELAEGYYRTAISRAYFAAFNIAKQALPQQISDRCPRDADAHEYVKRAYANGTSREQQIVSDNLDRLRIARNLADYRTAWTGARNQCAAELVKAYQTIERVRSHPL
jgi:uncharacterized protein (UPF0332 family)